MPGRRALLRAAGPHPPASRAPRLRRQPAPCVRCRGRAATAGACPPALRPGPATPPAAAGSSAFSPCAKHLQPEAAENEDDGARLHADPGRVPASCLGACAAPHLHSLLATVTARKRLTASRSCTAVVASRRSIIIHAAAQAGRNPHLGIGHVAQAVARCHGLKALHDRVVPLLVVGPEHLAALAHQGRARLAAQAGLLGQVQLQLCAPYAEVAPGGMLVQGSRRITRLLLCTGARTRGLPAAPEMMPEGRPAQANKDIPIRGRQQSAGGEAGLQGLPSAAVIHTATHRVAARSAPHALCGLHAGGPGRGPTLQGLDSRALGVPHALWACWARCASLAGWPWRVWRP